MTEGKYDQDSFINREDRRQIAYAGAIVRNLTQASFSLNYHYADSRDWSNYKRRIYSALIDAIERESNRQPLSQKEQELVFKSEKERLEIWAAKPWSGKSNNLGFVLPYRPDFTKFQPEKCPEESAIYCTFSFYFIGKEKDAPKWFERNTLDYLFAWNRSQQHAYKLINRQMPLEKLLKLQQEYFELAGRIRNQPEGEKGYDLDTSLNAPHLK